jgi:hypothetical protein
MEYGESFGEGVTYFKLFIYVFICMSIVLKHQF